MPLCVLKLAVILFLKVKLDSFFRAVDFSTALFAGLKLKHWGREPFFKR